MKIKCWIRKIINTYSLDGFALNQFFNLIFYCIFYILQIIILIISC